MHVDGAGHDDLAGDVVNLIGGAAFRLADDAAILDEDIADPVAIVHGVDDAAAFQLNEHQAAPFLPRPLVPVLLSAVLLAAALLASISSAMRFNTSATVGLSLFGLAALTADARYGWQIQRRVVIFAGAAHLDHDVASPGSGGLRGEHDRGRILGPLGRLALQGIDPHKGIGLAALEQTAGLIGPEIVLRHFAGKAR